MNRLTISLATDTLIAGLSDPTQITLVSAKRAASTPVELQFCKDGVGVELPQGTVVRFGVKAKGKLAGGYLVFASSFVKSGSDSSALYRVEPDWASSDLSDAFSAANEPDILVCTLEIQWTTPDGEEHGTQLVPLNLENCLNRGTEGAPSPANPLYALKSDLPSAASVNAAGVIQLASQTEVDEGTESAKAVTPDTLAPIKTTLETKAPLDSPAFTGTPTAPTPSLETNNTSLATTEFVKSALAAQPGGTVSYETKSTAFTAVAGGRYNLDTTEGSFEVTIDAALAVGESATFVDSQKTWGENPPTFLRNGHLIEGLEIDFTNGVRGGFFEIDNAGGANGLRILASGSPPINLIPPSIVENSVGGNITGDNGSWTGAPTRFTYLWQISVDGVAWTNIEGITTSYYTPTSDEVGQFVRRGVVAENANGPSVVTYSAASAAIIIPAFPIGAIAYWTMNEETGVRVDATGNGNDLTDNNTVGFTAGVIGNAASTDGTNWLLASETLLDDAAAFSVSVWVQKIAGVDIAKPIFSGYGNQGKFGIIIYDTGDGNGANIHALYQIGADGATDRWFFASNDPLTILNNIAPLVDGNWYHVVLTYDGTTVSLYINGQLVATNPASGTLNPFRGDQSLGIFFGSANDNLAVPTNVDETGLWERALSSDEIVALYNTGNGLAYPA